MIKVGIVGAYQVTAWDDHGRITLEQTEDGYKHVMKANILEYGDTNAYRYRIRAINNQSNIEYFLEIEEL